MNGKLLKNIKQFSTKLQRNNSFKTLDKSDLNYFKTVLSPEQVLTEDLVKYNIDWTNNYKGNSPCVLKPKSTEQVSAILKYCNSLKIAVVPQGGNTGLVGGSIPVYDEIILSLEKMNKIISHDEISATLHCEAGCILQSLHDYTNNKGYLMPIDLGAKGSCFMGGLLATNAGGIHFVKHGSMRKNCKGLKTVLADGTVIDTLNPLPKNNTGYDLKQLFIGSEGTLGVITECLVNTPFKLQYHDVVLLGVDKFEDILNIYKLAKPELKDYLNAIEFFDYEALHVQEKQGRFSPLEKKCPFYLLIEVSSNDPDNAKVLEDFISKIEVEDGVIAQDESQKRKIWEVRESIIEGASKDGPMLSYDVSVPLPHFYEVVEATRKRVGDRARVVGYGHIGDYNLHLAVVYKKPTVDQGFVELQNLMEPFLFDYISKYRGSISAEHGIGVNKLEYLNRSQTEESINLMSLIKKTLDPNGILNPYKILKV
jgi:FAD/FMN-containing dehydrogenase